MQYDILTIKDEVKLIRRTYRIRCPMRKRADAFRIAFAQVPPKAELIDEDADGDCTVLVFEETTEVKT